MAAMTAAIVSAFIVLRLFQFVDEEGDVDANGKP
jgi:hypothetical protein